MDLRAGRIRDPIHGYVPFTGIERVFLDHPVAQRLRWVAQSGLAHYVFPAVRTSRFEHSLGAMHLASRFLRSAVINTDPDLRADLTKGLAAAVQTLAEQAMPDPADVIETSTRDGLRCGDLGTGDERAALLLAEQGLRLAALFHDLGHLPFSHDFEYALGRLLAQLGDQATVNRQRVFSQGKGSLAIHEQIGYRLASAIFHERYPQFRDRPGGRAAHIAYRIAETILQAAPPNDTDLAVSASTSDAVWGALHTLMAGELDVDRCDYLLRDARQYGFEFATYDLDRLADNLTFARPRPDQEQLAVAIRPQGVAAAESFLLARYRAYQWGPRHHKVAQVGAALQHTIEQILRPVLTTPGAAPELEAFLGDLERIAADDQGRIGLEEPSILERFATYDDVWWLGLMRGLEPARRDGWTDLVLSRGRGPVSLWKRPDQFPLELVTFNEGLPDLEDDESLAKWQRHADSMAPDVLIVRHPFCPWDSDRDTPQQSTLQVATDQGLVPLTDLSALTASLREVWRRDIQVQAFALTEGHDPAALARRLAPATTTGDGNE